MVTTDKFVARELASLLEAHGVGHAVVSPGTRNAPLVTALCACRSITVHTVIDERSAGFIALGISLQCGGPVALVCTSGSALLNYAPAVAEAYYRQVPLIVVSADRPGEWIGQDDSQTIVQPGALSNIVKVTRDIPATADMTDDGRRTANRDINDAMIAAMSAPSGPVHINVRLAAPLGGTDDIDVAAPRVIKMLSPEPVIPERLIDGLVSELASSGRILVVAGFMPPSPLLREAFSRLAALPGVVIMAEAVANAGMPGVIDDIDTLLGSMTADELDMMLPDTVISVGGAVVSQCLKAWLRSAPSSMSHWQVGARHVTADCFGHLTLRVEADAPWFISRLAAVMPSGAEEYSLNWSRFRARALSARRALLASASWSDLVAVARIMERIPAQWNLHFGNGSAVRLAQMCDCSRFNRIDSNRGVSGIDGCTSTAVGAALVADRVTMLLSGDMSALYDIGALTAVPLPARFKIVVLVNGGGNIFRIIGNTRNLPVMEDRLACRENCALDWHAVATAMGLAWFEARDADSLDIALEQFIAESSSPAMLAVVTDPGVSADILKSYYKNIKNILRHETMETDKGI